MSFKTSIGNVALKRHLYTLDLQQGQPSYVVEKALARLESDVSPLLSELIQTESLFNEPPKRALFAEFLATLLMRSRQGLQIIHGYREEVRVQVDGGSARLPAGLVRDLMSRDGEGMRELFAKSVLPLAGRLSKNLEAMHWRLLRADEDYLITSENPLVIYNQTEERWGLGTPGTHIHIAISPTLLLHLGREATIPGDGTVALPRQGVKGANGLTIMAAEQFIFSHTSFDGLGDVLADRTPGAEREFGPAR